MSMAENENYVQGQEIEPISDTRVYVHKDVLKYLDLYQELGTIPQLRALNDERDKYLLMCREYSAIGTVEEFKAYKLGDCMNDCEHYENCSNYIYSKGYNKAIDDFAEKIIDLVNDFPTVEDDWGELRPMQIEEMCNEIAEQLKGEKQ
jgi:hypothetical protein